jgi:NADH-quinone oxidoreductase subunit N
MISLAGLPPAAGFFGKFYLFTLAIDNGYLWSVIIAVIGSLISIYYYFKVIISLFGNSESATTEKISVPILASIGLVFLAIGLLFIGLFPDLLVSLGRLL